MSPTLASVRQIHDKAVEAAYRWVFEDDSQWVAFLFELYQCMAGELFVEGKKKRKVYGI